MYVPVDLNLLLPLPISISLLPLSFIYLLLLFFLSVFPTIFSATCIFRIEPILKQMNAEEAETKNIDLPREYA